MYIGIVLKEYMIKPMHASICSKEEKEIKKVILQISLSTVEVMMPKIISWGHLSKSRALEGLLRSARRRKLIKMTIGVCPTPPMV